MLKEDPKLVGYSDRDQAKTTEESSLKKTEKVDCNDEDKKEESKNCDDDSDLKVLGYKEKAQPILRKRKNDAKSLEKEGKDLHESDLTLSKAHEQSVVRAVMSDDRDVKVAKQEILKEVSDELELPKQPSREESTKTTVASSSLPSLDTEATSSTEESS